jgi:hypothetical protein
MQDVLGSGWEARSIFKVMGMIYLGVRSGLSGIERAIIAFGTTNGLGSET